MARIRAGGGIGYEGLNQLNRDLRAIGKEAQGELKKANVSVATKEGTRAQQAAFGLGGVAAHAAPSIKGGGSTTWAGIKFGSGHPEAMGAEFGGGRRPTTQQFKPWLGHTGYAIYPTIRRDNEEITSTWFEAIENLMKEHGL
jgi:hypothetical protein